ncbi:MAG: hypothetical protein WDN26_19400 [Chitinophagaceae bacterium]
MKKKFEKLTKDSTQQLAITAKLEEFWFVEKLVEELADRSDINRSNEMIVGEWQDVTTSSLEALVCGNMTIADEKNTLQIEFISSFFFTCCSDDKGMKLTWSNSLS